MGLFSRRQTPPGAHNFDSPAAGTKITTPDIHLRGWFALPVNSRISRVELVGEGGYRQAIRLCQRDDAQNVHKQHLVVGVDQRVSIEPLVNDQTLQYQVRIHCGRDYYEFPFECEVASGFESNDGYYVSRDHLDQPDARTQALTEQQRNDWRNNGFLVLKGFFDQQVVNSMHTLVDELWADRRNQDYELSIDAYAGTTRQGRIRFGDVEDDARQQTYKLNDLFVTHAQVRDLILEAQLAATIGDLLNGDPVVCNTLYFEYGSQQDDHFDTFYMPPKVRNKMLATWIALDSADASNGSLRYYPGSHQIAPYVFSNGMFNETTEEMPACMEYIRKELAKRNIQPVHFHAEPGDVFIWHAHLLHGGSAIADRTLTRRSLVTHYYRTCDLAAGDSIEHAPGRYYMNRPPAPATLPSHHRLEFEKQVTR